MNAYWVKQQGTALIIALFITALVAITAISMMERLQIDVRRTTLILNANQAYFYADGSVNWAKEQLKDNWKKQKKNQIVDRMPIYSGKSTVQNAVISSSIEDLTGYLNINNLTTPTYQEMFERLLRIVSPKIEPKTAHDITLAVIDWISPTQRNLQLEDYYAKQKPPFRAPHRPMVSISELRLVKGMTKELFVALSPNISAITDLIPTPININTATIPIIMSLSPTLTKDTAMAIVKRRQQKPFASIEELNQWEVIKNNPIPAGVFPSPYFLVKTQVNIQDQNVILFTALKRTLKNDNPIIEVIWQSKGTL